MKPLRWTMVAIAITIAVLGGQSFVNTTLAQEGVIAPPEVRALHKVCIKAWCLNTTTPVAYVTGCSDVSEELALGQAIQIAITTLGCPEVQYEIRPCGRFSMCPPEDPSMFRGVTSPRESEYCWKVDLKCFVRCGEPFLVTGFGRTRNEARCNAKREMCDVAETEGFQVCSSCYIRECNQCCCTKP